MSEKGNFVVMLDSIGCLIRVDEDNREWSHDEDEPLIRYSDHDRIATEQAHRIDGLDAMLRQARVWSEEKDKRIEALEEEREQLRAEISQYEWLLTQAKTRAREHEGANEIHPNAQTGQAGGNDAT